jgi:two-component system chemotaxis response regulator CheB
MPQAADAARAEAMSSFDPLGDAEPTDSSGFTCPDCHGALWELSHDGILRFRCRVGHSFAPESLFTAQSDKLEDALWASYRALEESAALAQRLSARASERGHASVAARWTEKYDVAVGRVRTLREALDDAQFARGEADYDG